MSAIIETVILEWNETRAYEEQASLDIVNEWKQIEELLLNPGGLFGADHPDPFVRWQLDTSEGPARIRGRMVRHLDFYKKYKSTNPISAAAGKHRAPRSSFVEELEKARNPNLLRNTRSSSLLGTDETFCADSSHDNEIDGAT